jgi:hypothetical protein
MDHDKILFDHIVETLPRDIDRRRAVLNALCSRLNEGPHLTQALGLLSHIDSHLLMLRELELGGSK